MHFSEPKEGAWGPEGGAKGPCGTIGTPWVVWFRQVRISHLEHEMNLCEGRCACARHVCCRRYVADREDVRDGVPRVDVVVSVHHGPGIVGGSCRPDVRVIAWPEALAKSLPGPAFEGVRDEAFVCV